MSRIAVVFAGLIIVSQSVSAVGEPIAAATFRLPALSDTRSQVLGGDASLVRVGATTAMLSTLSLTAQLRDGYVGEFVMPAAITEKATYAGNFSFGIRRHKAAARGWRLGIGVRIAVPTHLSSWSAEVARGVASSGLERWPELLAGAISGRTSADALLEKRRFFVQLHGAFAAGHVLLDEEGGAAVTAIASAGGGVRFSRVALIGQFNAVVGEIPTSEEDRVEHDVFANGGVRVSVGSANLGLFVRGPIAASTDSGHGIGLEMSRAF